MARDQRFRKHDHLRLRSDFARVFARKWRAGDDVLAVYVARNGLSYSRLGLSVSKKIGNAVHRNYVRRRIREAFRTSKAEIPEGFDIICVARPKATDPRRDLGCSLRTLVANATGRCSGSGAESRCRSDPDTYQPGGPDTYQPGPHTAAT